MIRVQELHREAMELADEATLAQVAGDTNRAKALFMAAFEREREAAELFAAQSNLEPTRSVLFRSAASLALDCGDYRSAEKLVARALSGDPPPAIADELRDLLEEVNFQRHLDVRGVVLEPREFQMTLAGKAVGYGMAESDLFIGRVQDLQRLIYRTAERQAGRPFRERGRPDKALAKAVGVYLSVPRAASFAVTVRVGYSKQLYLPGMDAAQSVIDELLDCLDALGREGPDSLAKRIPDPAYRRNFIALARRLAPDGDSVRVVGFTANPRGSERRVLLTRTASEIAPSEPPDVEPEAGHQVIVQGTLKFADSTKAVNHRIKLVDSHGKKHTIIVPDGMMDDIVRPLWDYEVTVVGVRHGKDIFLKDISRCDVTGM